MAPKKQPMNGVARLLEETGLSAQQLANKAYVKNERTKAGRETIRRYAYDLRWPEDAWNEDVILDLAAATECTVASISELAAERLEARFDLGRRRIRWTATQLQFWPRSADTSPAESLISVGEGHTGERRERSA